ncbi:MAG TPA: hypothetical protein PKA27_01615 [Fimbriimonadaceae bacterium]|nr:hypothetical protein [Fimbriimonadaceae bacterium]
MTPNRIFRSPVVALVTACVLVALCTWQQGRLGAIGAVAGVLGVSLNFFLMWLGVSAFGNLFKRNPETRPRLAGTFLALAILVKLPILVGIGLWVQTLGGSAMSCFLIALGVVYFWAIGWAVTNSDEPVAASK